MPSWLGLGQYDKLSIKIWHELPLHAVVLHRFWPLCNLTCCNCSQLKCYPSYLSQMTTKYPVILSNCLVRYLQLLVFKFNSLFLTFNLTQLIHTLQLHCCPSRALLARFIYFMTKRAALKKITAHQRCCFRCEGDSRKKRRFTVRLRGFGQGEEAVASHAAVTFGFFHILLSLFSYIIFYISPFYVLPACQCCTRFALAFNKCARFE